MKYLSVSRYIIISLIAHTHTYNYTDRLRISPLFFDYNINHIFFDDVRACVGQNIRECIHIRGNAHLPDDKIFYRLLCILVDVEQVNMIKMTQFSGHIVVVQLCRCTAAGAVHLCHNLEQFRMLSSD